MLIENIYSTHQQPYNPSRSEGGITFLPGSNNNNVLRLNIEGDSRVGCIHYVNTSTAVEGNKLIFEGAGSITVADADYYIVPNNLSGSQKVTGYYSNRGCSVIGINSICVYPISLT